MPIGVYIKTEEHKRNISEALRGKVGNNKGKHWKMKDTSKMKKTEETKKKMREAHIGKPSSMGMLGKHHSIKTRKKVSEKMKGEKNPNWKDGASSENHKIRDSIEFRLWREAVFARDNWTCQKYKIRGVKLHSHHIKNFADYPELRFAIDNGITFSEKAHKEFHKKYGYTNNQEQLEEFLEL